jgi:hypothetical protein
MADSADLVGHRAVLAGDVASGFHGLGTGGVTDGATDGIVAEVNVEQLGTHCGHLLIC